MKKKALIPLIPIALIAASMTFSNSCANTTQAPSGGPKDTIPPSLIAVSPAPGELNVPTHNTQISFTFDEYVAVKDQKNIYLSPPMEKPFKSKLKGKSVVVTFDEDLLPNTTYTIDISGAIADNNEGNMFPGYTLTFSTGNQIDSMYITGIVQDCNTLKPAKGATVMLYKDQADSAVFLHRPDAAVKADDWGFFCLRNIQDTTYRLYAIMDQNTNNKYDLETDLIAFCDEPVTPVNKVGKDIFELYKFDMLDTASCMKRKTEYELNLFKGVTSKQMIVNKERTSERSAYITFMSPYPRIDSIWFKGIPAKRVIKQFNQKRDSVLLWVNSQKKIPDTLKLNVKYMKTDSTDKLVRTLEKIKLTLPKELKKSTLKSMRKEIKHEDTIAVYKANYSPETFEQYGIELSFNYPLIKEGMDKLKYEVTNPKQKVEKGRYTWYRDTSDLRVFHIMHSGKILPGYEYKLTVPERMFRDINGFYNDSTVVKVKLPDDDKLSSMTVVLKGTKGSHYIIDLMSEKRDKVLWSYSVSSDKSLLFPYLKEGKYCIRITEDKNGNNMVDTGDLLKHLQPEKVRFFKLRDGDFLIDIPSSVEITQDLDLEQIFK